MLYNDPKYSKFLLGTFLVFAESLLNIHSVQNFKYHFKTNIYMTSYTIHIKLLINYLKFITINRTVSCIYDYEFMFIEYNGKYIIIKTEH